MCVMDARGPVRVGGVISNDKFSISTLEVDGRVRKDVDTGATYTAGSITGIITPTARGGQGGRCVN